MQLVTIDSRGLGYNLSDKVDDLRYSNVAPGGDETCTFTLRRSWRASNPEIQRGNIVRVLYGLDVLWQGRVEETDRSGGDAETIAVTAYGLGARLKDTTMQEVYVDRDLSHWVDPSTQRHINLTLLGAISVEAGTVAPDTSTGQPALAQQIKQSSATITPYRENWYDASGLTIGSIYYAWAKNANLPTGSANWTWKVYVSNDDVGTTTTNSGDLDSAGTGTGTLAGGSGYKFGMVQVTNSGAGLTADQDYTLFWTCLAVFGNHGLSVRGTQSATSGGGFYASDIIRNAVGRAAGITLRRVDDTAFVVEQAEYREPAVIEDVVADANQYDQHQRTWGTWGPNSPLDISTNGYFDYTTVQSTPSWLCFREEADDLDLHAETATLYNQVDVNYSDVSGAQHIVTRTASVPDLTTAGITRKARIDGGTLTTAGAQTLGDAFLALSGGYAPARGSLTVSQPIRHATRGRIPPVYLRADGSAIRLPDILPSTTAFSLDSTPDKRTTFPIKRVEVDASQNPPRVTAELDQTNDVLTALQARLGLAAQLTIS